MTDSAWKVLVVDDEAPARATVARHLRNDSRFLMVGEAGDGVEALERIEALCPDLVVLDVQMPGLDGFEVLDALGPEPRFPVIFSTAFDRYAVRAFDAAAVDYLLKPWDAARLARALDRAASQLSGETSRSHFRPRPERLVVKADDGWRALELGDISRLDSANKHVAITTSAGQVLVRQPLHVLEARLDPNRFVRVHRSTLVNVAHVSRLEGWTHGDGILVMRDGATVVLSRTWRAAFVARFGAGQ